jgi:hypothetical protein
MPRVFEEGGDGDQVWKEEAPLPPDLDPQCIFFLFFLIFVQGRLVGFGGELNLGTEVAVSLH